MATRSGRSTWRAAQICYESLFFLSGVGLGGAGLVGAVLGSILESGEASGIALGPVQPRGAGGGAEAPRRRLGAAARGRLVDRVPA